MLEREIKFRIPEERDAVAVRDAIEDAGFRLESSGIVVHEDRYLDTEDWVLYRTGITLRLRREGARVELQAKTIRSQSEEFLARTEWKQEAPPGEPPWPALPDGPVAFLLRPLEKLPDLAERERPYALYEGDRLADVAAKTLGRHLTRMFWNEPGTRLNLDPNYLHDMRVATRRLRTALLVFAIAIPGDTTEALGRDLRWIGRALGSVRDLDVGLKRVAAMAARAPEHERAALYVFARFLEIKRARRRMRLLQRLDSKRFDAFRERAQKWIAGPPDLWVPIGAPEPAGTTGVVQPALAPAYMVGPRIVAEWDNRMRE